MNRQKSPPLPRRLQVEVTASCNLRCQMCVIGYRDSEPDSPAMGLDVFRQLVEGLPDLEAIALQGVGEPLMARDIYEMISWASERGIRTDFNTNATLLTKSAGARLIDAGLNALQISLDAAEPETYEAIRRDARWETVTRNVSNFVALKRARGSSTPDLSVVMVLMQRNLDEIPGVVRLAAKWGITDVFAQGLSHDFSDTAGADFASISRFVEGEQLSALPRSRVEEAFGRAREEARECGVNLRLPNLAERAEPIVLDDGTAVGCDWPWQGGYVARDGSVLPCCMIMGEGRATLGNLNEHSYAEIWSSEEFERFREGLRSGNPPSVCAGCSLYRGTF